MPRARGLADQIENQLGHGVDLVRSGGGIFDVHLGDELVFSKHRAGGFPDEEQLLNTLRGG